jgi:hypothetical protein
VKVFVEVARALIEEDANLNILSYANGLAACPSWVPDWGIANDREHFINDNFESPRYYAALRTTPRISASVHDFRSLTLQGRKFDVVSSNFEPQAYMHQIDYTDSEFPMTQIATLSEYLGLPDIYPFTGETSDVAYFRTIMTDIFVGSPRASYSTADFIKAMFPSTIQKCEFQEGDNQLPSQLERRVQI